MKVEVGKFYSTRDGEKVSVSLIGADVSKLSNGRSVWTDTGTVWNKNSELFQEESTDLISEWKEETVSGPKFKVGDRITRNFWPKDGYEVARIVGDSVYLFAPDKKSIHIYSLSGIDWIVVSRTEDAKPEITVNSLWTNIGKESKTVEVVYLNDKYVTFVHKRGTIETTTLETFGEHYKPYVKPPKTLVGWVGVIDDGDSARFTLVCNSEQEVRSIYSSVNYNIVSVKKIEWTEGE